MVSQTFEDDIRFEREAETKEELQRKIDFMLHGDEKVKCDITGFINFL